MKGRIRELVGNRWLVFASRLVLGDIFIAASISKLQYQAKFIDTVISYGILPDSLAQFYGFIIPWVELFIGCALVLGIFSRFASAISIPLVISFVVANVYGSIFSIADTCGCFGPLVALSRPVSLVVDLLMLLMAGQLLLYRAAAEFLGIGSLLSERNLGLGRRGRFIFEKTSKFAIVAIAMVVVVSFTGGAQGSLEPEINSVPGSDTGGAQGSLDTETDSTAGFDNGGAQSSLNAESGSAPGSDAGGAQSSLDTEIDSAPGSDTGGAQIPQDSEIDSALESGKLAFVCFYRGCPCELESQFEIIADLEQEYGDRIVFVRIKHPQTEQEFDVTESPTMLLITGKDDEGEYIVYQRFEGTTDKETLKDSFAQVLRD